MDQLFYAEFDIDFRKFNRKIEEAKKTFESLSSKTKEKYQLEFDTRVDSIREMERELKLQKKYVAELEREFMKLDDILASGQGTSEQVAKWNSLKRAINDNVNQLHLLEADLVEAQDGLSEMPAQVASWTDKVKLAGKGLKDLENGVKKTAQTTIKSFKRMALSIVGIQSVFSVITKATNAYLNQNEELSNKLKASWIGLGSFLAPVIEKIINLFVRLVQYLNAFVYGFTGVDYLGKAMADATKKTNATTKAVKQLKGQLAGFDELNNIGQDTSGSGTSASTPAWVDAFKDAKVDTTWVDRITEFGEWVRKNWGTVTGLILGTVEAFKLLSMGVDGFIALGVGLIIWGIADAIQGVIDFLQSPTWANFARILEGLSIAILGVGTVITAVFGIATGGVTLIIGAVGLLVSFIIKNWDGLIIGLKRGANSISIIFKQIKDIAVSVWTAIKNGAVNIWDKIKTVFGNIGKWFSDKWKGIKEGFKGFANGIVGLFEGIVNMGISAVNGIIKALNKIKFDVPAWVPILGGKTFGFNLKEVNQIQLARLDTGTNYVPSDQLAMIHKGEAVIPKRFNSEEYFGQEEVVTVLYEFMDLVRSKNYQPVVAVKDVAKAVNGYNNEQARIQGRTLVTV